MLRALREVLTPREPTTFLRVGSSWPVEVPKSALELPFWGNPARNIAEAQKEGIRPVNFKGLLKQFTREQLVNAVLFDSPPSGVQLGNHWRILAIDDERDLMDIQLSATALGTLDEEVIPPLTVSQYDILFTGLTLSVWEYKGRPASLQEVNEVFARAKLPIGRSEKYPRKIRETIYFANRRGELIETANHPLFRQKVKKSK